MSRPLPATEPWAVVAGRVALHLPIHSQVEYSGAGAGGRGPGGLGERRCNCTLPAAAAQPSHTFLQACPNTEFYLCSVRHLWSTERNWGTVHRGSEEGVLQNRTPPSLPCLSISWEPRESERQKYQFLEPREKGPPGWGWEWGANKGSVPMQDCSELQSWRLDKGATSGRKQSRARQDWHGGGQGMKPHPLWADLPLPHPGNQATRPHLLSWQ